MRKTNRWLGRVVTVVLGIIVGVAIVAGPSEAKPPPKSADSTTAPPVVKSERVGEVAGARWSGVLGFVKDGDAPGAEEAEEAGNLMVPAVNVPGGS
jgi:hypothetical protein